MTLTELVGAAAARLRAAGLDTPGLDARVLALEAFGLDHASLIRRGGEQAAPDALDRLEAMAERRAAGEPTARILGRREFWGLDFRVSPATLVPRPDTETVVQAALDAVKAKPGPLTILDLGTGAGCLLLAILSEREDATGVGIDRSAEAAATARGNSDALGLGHRASFLVGDWASAIDARFDLVVSNPPYIAAGDIDGLDVEVRDHDPRLALDGGPDGLDAYAIITRDAPRLLAPGGALTLEIGAGQDADVSRLAADVGLSAQRVAHDLGGIARALVCARAAGQASFQKTLGIPGDGGYDHHRNRPTPA